MCTLTNIYSIYNVVVVKAIIRVAPFHGDENIMPNVNRELSKPLNSHIHSFGSHLAHFHSFIRFSTVSFVLHNFLDTQHIDKLQSISIHTHTHAYIFRY